MSSAFHSGANGHSPARSLKRMPSGRAAIKGSSRYGKAVRSPGIGHRGGSTKVLSHPATRGNYKRVSSGGLGMGRTTIKPVSTRIGAGRATRTARHKGTMTIQASRARQAKFTRGVAIGAVGGGALLAGTGAVGGALAARHVVRRVKVRRAARAAHFRAGGGRGSFRDIRSGYRSVRGGQKRDSRGRFA